MQAEITYKDIIINLYNSLSNIYKNYINDIKGKPNTMAAHNALGLSLVFIGKKIEDKNMASMEPDLYQAIMDDLQKVIAIGSKGDSIPYTFGLLPMKHQMIYDLEGVQGGQLSIQEMQRKKITVTAQQPTTAVTQNNQLEQQIPENLDNKINKIIAEQMKLVEAQYIAQLTEITNVHQATIQSTISDYEQKMQLSYDQGRSDVINEIVSRLGQLRLPAPEHQRFLALVYNQQVEDIKPLKENDRSIRSDTGDKQSVVNMLGADRAQVVDMLVELFNSIEKNKILKDNNTLEIEKRTIRLYIFLLFAHKNSKSIEQIFTEVAQLLKEKLSMNLIKFSQEFTDCINEISKLQQFKELPSNTKLSQNDIVILCKLFIVDPKNNQGLYLPQDVSAANAFGAIRNQYNDYLSSDKSIISETTNYKNNFVTRVNQILGKHQNAMPTPNVNASAENSEGRRNILTPSR